MMKLRRWIPVVSLSALLALGVSCEFFDIPVPAGSLENFEVTLVNDSMEPIHILAADEGPGSSNRLSPGQARDIKFRGAEDGYGFVFIAVRNDSTLATTVCTFDGEPLRSRIVSYVSGQSGRALACAEW